MTRKQPESLMPDTEGVTVNAKHRGTSPASFRHLRTTVSRQNSTASLPSIHFDSKDMQTRATWVTQPQTETPGAAGWNNREKQTTRAAYTPRSTRLPARTLNKAEEKSHGHLWVQSLQTRMLLHTLFISITTLFVLGVVLAFSGLYQAHSFERQQAMHVRNTFTQFLDDQVNDLATPPSTATEVLNQFIKTQPATENGALLGLAGGKVVAHQTLQSSTTSSDEELIAALLKHSDDRRSTQFSVSTSLARYSVGVTPFTVTGSDRGILVIATDYDADLAPTLAALKLYVGISLVVAALLALINSRVSGSLLAPLRRMRNMMASISSQQDLSKRLPVRGNDDLAQLALQANGMIERLQGAFEKERELLNDVGHELRTPLTIVRGHLELMDPSDPEETIHTRNLALGELSRMHRLTEDLVTVAKSDRPDFLRPQRINVGDILMDAFEHASQLGNFDWKIDELTMATTTADPERLQQALLQLCQNATKFSAEGTTVALGAALDKEPQLLNQLGQKISTQPAVGPRLMTSPQQELPHDTEHHLYLWVRDLGIGVEPKNQQRIFERFARVDHSLSGSGLGLSIVNAIAQAHRGYLQLRSKPDVGSVFTLVLPISDPDYIEEIKGETDQP